MWIAENVLRVAMAIASVESGLDPFAVGDNGKAAGMLQMHSAIIRDVNRVHPTLMFQWPGDAGDPNAALIIMQLYMQHYGAKDIEDAARLWNGGPRRRANEDYVSRVVAIYNDTDYIKAAAMFERVQRRWHHE